MKAKKNVDVKLEITEAKVEKIYSLKYLGFIFQSIKKIDLKINSRIVMKEDILFSLY